MPRLKAVKNLIRSAVRPIFIRSQNKGFRKLPRGALTFHYRIFNKFNVDWKEIENVRKTFHFTDLLLFHGTAMELDGKAVVVSGPHGIGKSTAMRSMERQGFVRPLDDGIIIVGKRGGKFFVLESGTYGWRKRASVLSKLFRLGSGSVFSRNKPVSNRRVQIEFGRAYLGVSLPTELITAATLKDRSKEHFEPREIELRKLVYLPHPQDPLQPKLIRGGEIAQIDNARLFREIPEPIITFMKPGEGDLAAKLRRVIMPE